MAKLDEILPIMYRDMHAGGAFSGRQWLRHIDEFAAFLRDDSRPVLDFGCGPLGGLREAYGADAIPFDPYVPEFAADPWGANPRAVFSCDVLEHLPLHQLRGLANRICAAPSVAQVFLVISTRAANKVMPNGMNAHLTVRGPDWWHGFLDFSLGRRMERALARYDMIHEHVVFAYQTGAGA